MRVSKQYAGWALLALATIFVLRIFIDIAVQRTKTPHYVKGELALLSDTVRASDLTPDQLEMLLAVDDPTFFQHNGIDFKTPGQGLTTISQSVGKKLYFHPFIPGIRKFRLVYLSRWALDPTVSKDQQLSLYLRILWYGTHENKSITGLGNAVRTYFGREIAELSRHEFLSLIAMHPAPKQFHFLDNPKNNEDRVARIEMVLSGSYEPEGLLDTYYDGAPLIKPARDPIPLPDKTDD